MRITVSHNRSKEEVVQSVDKSFNEFQLILCRNVLIYFNQQLQNKVIDLFYESLCPLGFLALGNKESLLFAESRKRFEEIDRKERIFIKTGEKRVGYAI